MTKMTHKSHLPSTCPSVNHTSHKLDLTKIIFFTSDSTEHQKTSNVQSHLTGFNLTSRRFNLTSHRIMFCVLCAENANIFTKNRL